jgi:hypothetical protein
MPLLPAVKVASQHNYTDPGSSGQGAFHARAQPTYVKRATRARGAILIYYLDKRQPPSPSLACGLSETQLPNLR